MESPVRSRFLAELKKRYGDFTRLPESFSLFDIGRGVVRVYVRYSKVHKREDTFFGLRKQDLQKLEGHNSVICFLWDNQKEPLLIPYSELEEIFSSLTPASDGQFKAQVLQSREGWELYIARQGRFNVERFIGWEAMDVMLDRSKLINLPDLTHSQVQTLLGSIGTSKGYDVWIPHVDRGKLDWALAKEFAFRDDLPTKYIELLDVIKEIDVIWLQRGSSNLKSFFEVEHSTTIYSALLRFNDFFLSNRDTNPKYNIVASDVRRSQFLKQLGRPTFQSSGLAEVCNFLEYRDVYGWFTLTERR